MVPGLSKGRLTTNAVVETMLDAMAAGGATPSTQQRTLGGAMHSPPQ